MKFQIPSSSESNYSRQSGDIRVLNGDLYESAVLNLFARDINTDTYACIMQKAEIFFENSEGTKDIDCYFITKRQLNLKLLQDLWIGSRILYLGKLDENGEFENKTGHPFPVLPKNAVAFIEIKKAHDKYTSALEQQVTNLQTLHKWISTGFKYKFFKSNSYLGDHNLKQLLMNEGDKEDKPSIYLIVVINGDSTEIPSKEKIKEALKSRDRFLMKCFRNHKGQIGCTLYNDREKKILKFKVEVIFLYIPNYVSNSFLNSLHQNKIEDVKKEMREQISTELRKEMREQISTELRKEMREQVATEVGNKLDKILEKMSQLFKGEVENLKSIN